jgi:hypothetical protein
MTKQTAIRAATCLVCGNTYVRWDLSARACSVECAIKFVRYENQRAQQTPQRRKRNTYGDPDIAQYAFNEFVRLNEVDADCISCGCTTQGRQPQWAAGHYRSISDAPQLRFNEDNVHKQCNRSCNQAKSGNLIEYRKRLIDRIGLSRVTDLEANTTRVKWTPDELQEITMRYRRQTKELLAARRDTTHEEPRAQRSRVLFEMAQEVGEGEDNE